MEGSERPREEKKKKNEGWRKLRWRGGEEEGGRMCEMGYHTLGAFKNSRT